MELKVTNKEILLDKLNTFINVQDEMNKLFLGSVNEMSEDDIISDWTFDFIKLHFLNSTINFCMVEKIIREMKELQRTE